MNLESSSGTRAASVLPAAGALAVFAGASALSGFLATPRGSSDWAYRLARKPSWEVSDAAMGPAWGTGFVLLTLSGWQAWRTLKGAERNRAVGAWAAYAVANAAVAQVGAPIGKTAWKDALELVGLGAYALTARKSRSALALVLPYIAWVAYVSAATSVVRRRNPLLSRWF